MSAVLPAQSNRGHITGTVTDITGALVPDAQITARHTQTGVSTETKSTGEGNYRLPELPVGQYNVTVSAPGFKAGEYTGVVVSVNATSALDVVLTPGQVNETVSVVADAPSIQTESSDVGTTVTPRQVVELPLAVNGVGGMRSPEAFVFLTPGSMGPGTATDNGINSDGGGQNGGAFQSKITGSQNFANEVLIDGASMFRSENGSSFDETAQSVESIEEFRVLTSTYPADFGRTGGGVTSFVTKSGTNEYHGLAYDIFRNRELNANRWFLNARGTDERPLDNHNDFGGTIGGPVRIPGLYNGTNKTFFFFSYEGFRRTGGGPVLSTIPTPDFLRGDFSALLDPVASGNQNAGNVIGTDALGREIRVGQIFDPDTTRTVNGQTVRDPFANNIVPENRWSNVARNVVPLFPDPTLPGRFQNILYGGKSPVKTDSFTVKGDHNISERNKIAGSFTWRKNDRTANDTNLPEPLNSNSWKQIFTTYYLRVMHDFTFAPNLLNHLNLGFNRTFSDNRPFSADQNWAEQIGVNGVFPSHFPIFNLGGGISTIGKSNYNLNIDNGYRLNDTVSYIRGAHSLRFGIDVREQRYTPRNFGNSSGVFNFGNGETAAGPDPSLVTNTGFGFAGFLLGQVGSSDLSIPIDNQWRSQYLALYVQDDWKVNRSLTLNLGFRWDVDFPRKEMYDRFSSFDPTLPNPGAAGRLGALAFAGDEEGRAGTRTFVDTWYKNFGPRFGFAYAPNFEDGVLGALFGSRKTVIRGGYGIYYQALIYADFGERLSAGFGGGAPFSNPDPIEPAFQIDQGYPQNFPRPPFVDPTLRNGTDIEFLSREHGRPPMIQNWSLEVQRELAIDLIGSLGYVASKGNHLRSNLLNLNVLPAQYLNLGNLLFADINSPEARAANIPIPYSGFQGQVFQALRPYPQYQYINTDCCLENIGNSTFHSLQARIERRFRAGLTLLASYTFSKTLTDADSAMPVFATFSGGGIVQNPYNRRAEKALSNQDIPHVAVFTYLYELPFGEGKSLRTDNKVVDKIIGGWQINGVHRYQSGEPLSFRGFGGIPTLGGDQIRPDIVPGQEFWSTAYNGDAWNPLNDSVFNRQAFRDPNEGRAPEDPFRFGNMARTVGYLRWRPYYNEDFSIFKNNRIGERFNLQLRAEAFNVLNRVVFRKPNTWVPAGEFGRTFGQSNQPRTLQLQLRLMF
jgi:hypothetical protein